MAIKILLKFVTPFIVSIVDIINEIFLYLKLYRNFEISDEVFTLFNHTTGSSILLMSYVLFNSDKMCIYYKSACTLIIIFHVFSIIYLYTDITVLSYLYVAWIISLLSLILWTISVLGYKSYKTIHQACIREQTE